MKVSIEQETINSYILTIDVISFTVMSMSGEELDENEINALKELVKCTAKRRYE